MWYWQMKTAYKLGIPKYHNFRIWKQIGVLAYIFSFFLYELIQNDWFYLLTELWIPCIFFIVNNRHIGALGSL